MGIRELNQKIIDEFRANQGKVGGQLQEAPLLLLTTTGAKSGLTRTNPLAYVRDGDRYVIIASYAGARRTRLGFTTWSPIRTSRWRSER